MDSLSLYIFKQTQIELLKEKKQELLQKRFVLFFEKHQLMFNELFEKLIQLGTIKNQQSFSELADLIHGLQQQIKGLRAVNQGLPALSEVQQKAVSLNPFGPLGDFAEYVHDKGRAVGAAVGDFGDFVREKAVNAGANVGTALGDFADAVRERAENAGVALNEFVNDERIQIAGKAVSAGVGAAAPVVEKAIKGLSTVAGMF
ncbi:hypothetical protein ['Camptotheca acuminata' phytoplasma]|uniref:hypothetical protein n=1 Tax='Camptotheca acuminata' phytoplasma TaxID=3239192 RepID=UPI00351A4DB7